jgi:hypothetical protein
LQELVRRKILSRQLLSATYLYTASEPAIRQRQLLTRRSAQAVPTVTDASRLEVSPDELKVAILLFYSLLDEKQRRLYAALESLKLGHGGDRQLADFLGMDPHPIARGRRELLEHDVEPERVRKTGGGSGACWSSPIPAAAMLVAVGLGKPTFNSNSAIRSASP